MLNILVVNVGSWSDAIIGEYASWKEAYEVRDSLQLRSLSLGYDLNDIRYAVRIGECNATIPA